VRCSRSLHEQHQDEAFDAVVDLGNRRIVIQAKASFVRAEAKYSGIAEEFVAGIDELLNTSVTGEQPRSILTSQ
jgi:hypothetical protein